MSIVSSDESDGYEVEPLQEANHRVLTFFQFNVSIINYL